MLFLSKQTKTFYGYSFSHFSTSTTSIDESANLLSELVSEEILQGQTLKQLRTFARKHNISLKGNYLKTKIVNIILAHFLRIRVSRAPVEVLDRKFTIKTNDYDYIDVGLWFHGQKRLLDRCLSTRQFKNLLAHYVKKEKIEFDDPRYPSLKRTNDSYVFLPAILAVHAASHLSVELHYEILEYYLYSRASQIEAVFEAEIASLKQENINLQLGIKLNKKA